MNCAHPRFTAPRKGLLITRLCVKSSSTVRKSISTDNSAAAPAADAVAANSSQQQQQVWDYRAPDEVLQRNQEFLENVLNSSSSRAMLAPLTKGGNVPFRRLCCDFDDQLVTMGEMAFARKLIKGDRVERARLYKATNERCFGVQIATNTIAEGVAAAQLAQEAGATWLDINCGCPIYEATKRGMGAALLKKPTKLAKMVAGIAAAVSMPVTVKIRTGESEKKVNAAHVVKLLQQAGAAAVIVHGRTMEQRYKKAADWHLLSELVAANSIPIIGNGDILTYYEAADRQQLTGCKALMVGRGALIKPWIFQELREGRELLLTAAERVGVYRQLAAHMKTHFRDDDMGKRKAFYFFPWHFSFFVRYRPLPAEVFLQQSRQHPLIATRAELTDARVGETEEHLPLLERLLRCENEAAHGPIADIIWQSASDAEAAAQLTSLAEGQLAEWEAQLRASGRASDDLTAEG